MVGTWFVTFQRLMMDTPEQEGPPPVTYFLKRGTLMGAALGMLAGLVFMALVGVDPNAEVASIVFWRNWILIGAAIGLFLGGGAAWWFHSKCHRTNSPSPPEEQRSNPSKSSP